MTPTLADLVAPVEVSQFLTTTWGRTHQRFAGRHGRFADLMTWAELNRVLRQHRLDFPRLRLALDGEVLPAHEYIGQARTRRGEPVPRLLAAPLARRLHDGATLVLDAVDELAEPVGDLARGWSMNCGSGFRSTCTRAGERPTDSTCTGMITTR